MTRHVFLIIPIQTVLKAFDLIYIPSTPNPIPMGQGWNSSRPPLLLCPLLTPYRYIHQLLVVFERILRAYKDNSIGLFNANQQEKSERKRSHGLNLDNQVNLLLLATYSNFLKVSNSYTKHCVHETVQQLSRSV